MNSKLSIKMLVAGKEHSFTIARADEEKYRKAAKDINRKVNRYIEKYKDREDTLHYLGLVALQLAMELDEAENRTDIDPVLKELKLMDEELGDYLNKE